jgi:carbon storage regulator
MLVLTRKKNEMIRIGNDVVIKVISTGRGKVKLGIQAPTDVRVLRAELVNAVGRQQPTGCSTEQPGVLA